jgi:hypothetical protein
LSQNRKTSAPHPRATRSLQGKLWVYTSWKPSSATTITSNFFFG